MSIRQEDWWSIVLIFIAFASIAGNSLVVIAVWKKQSLRTTTNFLLVNLAISDITSLFFLLVRCVQFIVKLEKGVLADYLCKLFLSYNISVTASFVSFATLIVLAVERYHAVVKPLHSGSRLEGRKLRIVLASIWLTGLLFTSPLYYMTYYKEKVIDCRLEYKKYESFLNIYEFLGIVVFAFLPLAVITYCYFRIAHSLYSQNKVAVQSTSSASQRARLKRQIHVVKMSVTVTVVFAIFLLPLAGIILVNFVTGNSYKIHVYYYIGFFAEAGANPFIYAFQSSNFRNAFKDILTKCCH